MSEFLRPFERLTREGSLKMFGGFERSMVGGRGSCPPEVCRCGGKVSAFRGGASSAHCAKCGAWLQVEVRDGYWIATGRRGEWR